MWKEWWYSLDTSTSILLGSIIFRDATCGPMFQVLSRTPLPLDEDTLDPGLKPMRVDNTVFGVEHQLNPQLVVSAHYVRTRLNRTIEDIGRLVDGNEVYTIGNPGEGRFVMRGQPLWSDPGLPDAAAEARLRCPGAFAEPSFLQWLVPWRQLYLQPASTGNYAGLSSTDEIAERRPAQLFLLARSTPENLCSAGSPGRQCQSRLRLG